MNINKRNGGKKKEKQIKKFSFLVLKKYLFKNSLGKIYGFEPRYLIDFLRPAKF